RVILRAVADIEDAGAAKAGLPADTRVQAFPETQRFDDQRQLARVAAHLADPTPVPARLLAGNDALLAKHHRDAALGELQRGRGADDAAADDDDIGFGGSGRVAGNGIGTGTHGTLFRLCSWMENADQH